MRVLLLALLCCSAAIAAPRFVAESPRFSGEYQIKGAALCTTGKNTLEYLNKGSQYDPQVIHDPFSGAISLNKIKATLNFICAHQRELNDPIFIKKHFSFIRWYPNVQQTKALAPSKPLLRHLPSDSILMTKYYVHLASASMTPHGDKTIPLYGLPEDEKGLSLEQANAQKGLIRFQYGKQAILRGALKDKNVPVLAYLNRGDLEAALMQGTIIADFGPAIGAKTFNVHRCNDVAYNKAKNPYEQERYWYFKQVDGIKGYGKDADHKITVAPTVTFAGDLPDLGLGALLLIQYKNSSGIDVSQAGILADTGGAFENNLYQVDYLAGSYAGKTNYLKATRHLPDYVHAYLMILKG